MVFHSLDGIVATHHYLCRRAARKFYRSGLERSDLEQVAAIGLIKAARRFDPSLQTPFEAYAWIAIVGELMHHVRDHERAIRLPRRFRALELRFARSFEELLARLEREPSETELASAMNVSRTTIVELRSAREATQSIPIGETDATNRIESPDVSTEDRFLVQSAFSSLPQIERRVIAGVYVLGLTQLELARRLGISAKRVSRLHRAALGSMHRAWAS